MAKPHIAVTKANNPHKKWRCTGTSARGFWLTACGPTQRHAYNKWAEMVSRDNNVVALRA